MLIRAKRDYKFSGRSVKLQPGDNVIPEPDAKLLYLLERGARRGLWIINPPMHTEPEPQTGSVETKKKVTKKKVAKKATR